MSWHFSRALVAEYSAACCLAGAPSAPSNSMPTPGMYWSPDKTTDACRPSRSVMTYEPSTGSLGEDVLKWCLVASRARTSAQPERVQELEASEADSGARWHALLVKFSPDSCGWKTARCLWEEDLDWSCLTLPRWGSLHDGELWEHVTPGLPTSETASGSPRFPTPLVGGTGASTHNQISGRFRDAMAKAMALWPTPRASEAGPDFAKLSRSKTGISLQTAVAMWPTPRAANPGSRPNGKGGKILAEEVAIAEGLRERGQKMFPTPLVGGTGRSTHGQISGRFRDAMKKAFQMWPTPHGMSKDGKSNGPSGNELGNAVNRSMYPTPRTTGLDGGSNSNTFVKEFPLPFDQFTPDSQKHDPRVGGSLNPTWVEWLMGWPLGWTDCAVSATDKFRQWFASHTGS